MPTSWWDGNHTFWARDESTFPGYVCADNPAAAMSWYNKAAKGHPGDCPTNVNGGEGTTATNLDYAYNYRLSGIAKVSGKVTDPSAVLAFTDFGDITKGATSAYLVGINGIGQWNLVQHMQFIHGKLANAAMAGGNVMPLSYEMMSERTTNGSYSWLGIGASKYLVPIW